MSASQTIPGLTFLPVLGGAEQLWINLNGTDFRATTAQIAALGGSGGGGKGGLAPVFVAASGLLLAAGALYTVRTSLGAFSVMLPPLAQVPSGYLEVQDGDFFAATNNCTINVWPGDTIRSFSVSGITTYPLQVSGAIIRFTSLGNVWRATPYGSGL